MEEKPEEPQAPNILVEEENGRPLFKKDDKPRKKRVEQPKSKPGVAELLQWSNEAFAHISDCINSAYLKSKQKNNLRQLTKAECKSLEGLKVQIFASCSAFDEIDDNYIHSKLLNVTSTPVSFTKAMVDQNVNIDDMTLDQYRFGVVGVFVQQTLQNYAF